ncbi:MAG: 2'-5' RNA ligase family protein [Clostridium sp.]|uniref:2'-5' RNA ligase family protein n=1 Tax=Clostridium sp. TaxID=1506 RepID=UPI0025BD6DC1|nr:2'-5' RNA ligase family protein [Clostridium sp.]MCH3965594.1 2'-5' RNA ligase family protein [Clostridium sp.]MCI1716922.1 2'-5' RNA ligase family protein [Clostridium sp.]MCI1801148.1 2'-5' RNA ligase family protein [Clostridium sp.]MCI1815108.1 2'-5' RNA ligase family protein [Clostridium sp.]MCI1872011.1 2'-5' RNA ligase family protein [Clostridium sp.]
MKYYLVALFDRNSYSYIERIQRNMCRKYRLYKHMPVLHITLSVIDNPDVDKLDKIVSKLLNPYKNFKVEINGAICFEPPYKSVNLKIEKKGYIMRLARQLNDLLIMHKFNVVENIEKWDLHVSLANTNYAIREWSSKEYSAACETAKRENIHRMATIDRIALWKPINNKKEMVVKNFQLKDY